jgi:nitroreductase
MSNTTPTQIIESLEWRYATKVFDPSRKLTSEQLNLVKESMRLTPSSYGIQAWKFIEIKTPELRQKLKEIGWNQAQFTDSSSIFAICTYINPNSKSEELVQDYVDEIVKIRGVEAESLDGYKGMMVNAVNNGNTTGNPEYTPYWLDNQAYIVVGQVLTACALAGIDAIAMEGFEINKANEILGLEELGLRVKCFVAVGFRSDDDKYATTKKVRFTQEDLFIQK